MDKKNLLMELENVSFCYPTETEPTLKSISLRAAASEIVLLCGQSGCGKSTLLRHMKKNRIPFGSGSGEIWFDGQRLEEMDDRESARRIGFVGQDPENQIVTDTVWHELAFGLENLGVPSGEIRRRTAEMAAYLGMEEIFRMSVEHLSGGQKQLLNLASVMVMKPDLLILDEPTAQMDPIAANRFIQTLIRLNQDFGTTIILSEQRLEEVLPVADRVLFMHEGCILSEGQTAKSGWLVKQCEERIGGALPVREALPTALRVSTACAVSLTEQTVSPLSVREGREWLRNRVKSSAGSRINSEKSGAKKILEAEEKTEAVVLEAKGVSFAYPKGEQILRDFHLQVPEGSFFCILGGNGAGKTTALKLLCGVFPKCDRGKIKRRGRVLYLAQNPQSVFTEITAEDELAEMLSYGRADEVDVKEEVRNMLAFLELTSVAGHNPMDLSGGEKQRLALGKILLQKPDVLLLDEPTKGLDASFKGKLSRLFWKLRAEGMTIVMVSHDIEFCAANATHCGLLFDGCVISSGRVRDFFAGNSFYTTAAGRMAEGILDGCMLCEDIIGKVQAGERDGKSEPHNAPDI